jgi:signal transduction histidine kinase
LRYDDRLATVLGQPAADARGRAVQWRQLVELLARGDGISPDLAERALARIAQLMKDLPLDLLSATARAIAGRAVPAELVGMFAARGAPASAALLAAADLSHAGWRAVRAVAAEDVKPLLAALGHGSDLEKTHEAATTEMQRVASTTDSNSDHPPVSFAPREQDNPQEPGGVPVMPGGLFRWETGPTGEIDWVEGAPRAALVGRSVADNFAEAFAARLPFADEPLVMADEGLLAGEWRWSGAPTFFADTGRFAGYRGVALREGTPPEPAAETVGDFMPAEDDGLRELMHELRTPLNAIIGFGEIIEGQYLGPAHRSYRERAAEIVRQARSLSNAVDNLDLAARLRSGRLQGEGTSGLEAIRHVFEAARVEADARGVRLIIHDRAGKARIALPPPLAEKLAGQFTSAMIEPAIDGEQLGIVIDRLDTNLAIGIDRATALRGLSEQQILADSGRAGMRFALRLVQGLAVMTGGRLDIGADRLVLLLPLVD